MKNLKREIVSDAALNPQARAKAQNLRSAINTGKSTERFTKINSSDNPTVIITDNLTGNSAEVNLYAASEVMKTLANLFGGSLPFS